jgi:HEAT repeat protein
VKFDERERQSVLLDLASSDEEVRRLAVERIASLSTDEAIAQLVERLGDASWRVRKTAVERLVSLPERQQVAGALIASLADGENSGRRNAAVEALMRCGSPVVEQIIESLAVRDTDVRKLLVDVLAGIGDPRAVTRLVRLLSDEDPNVRAAAADALGAIGGEDAVHALGATAIRVEEAELVRFSALRAMAMLDVPLRAAELAPVLDDPVLRPAAFALLGREDDEEAVAILIKGLVSSSQVTREAAMRSLLQLVGRVDGSRATNLANEIREAARGFPPLTASAIAHLEDADLSTRLVLVQFLGILGGTEVVVPLLFAGRDEALAEVTLSTLDALGGVAERAIHAAWSTLDAVSRAHACQLFGRCEGDGSAARLLAALGDIHTDVRIAAIRAIGRRRIGSALPLLVGRLEAVAVEDELDSEEEIHSLADALIAMAQPDPGAETGLAGRVVELLCSSLDAASESQRIAVARVLGQTGRREDATRVEFLLKDPSAGVRRAAVDALARLDVNAAPDSLRLALADESPQVRIAAARALGASTAFDAIDDFRRLASDEDERVRAAAVRSLCLRFASSADVERRAVTLEIVDASLEDEATVALAAVEALREVGPPAALRAARVLAREEPELLQEAIRCVGSHAEGEGLELLLPLVAHPQWSVRAEAIQMLAERGVAKAVPPILRRLDTEQDEFVRGVILTALTRLEG